MTNRLKTTKNLPQNCFYLVTDAVMGQPPRLMSRVYLKTAELYFFGYGQSINLAYIVVLNAGLTVCGHLPSIRPLNADQ